MLYKQNRKTESPLHIISAQISELGLTLAQRSTDDKSNEIPAVQELLKTLNIKGHVVVADALNCQKKQQKSLYITVDQKSSITEITPDLDLGVTAYYSALGTKDGRIFIRV